MARGIWMGSVLGIGGSLLRLPGGVEDVELRRVEPVDGICMVDEAGYIGINAKDKFLYGSYTYACAYAAVCKGCDFSGAGLGKVTFFTGFDYGTLSFGGFDYRTIRIGDQEWMCDNLRYEVSGSRTGDDAYLATYGRMYTAAGAISAASQVEGWHIPSRAEWATLFSAVGGIGVAGTRLKSSDAGGEDTYGMSIVLGGEYTNQIIDIGQYAYYMTSSPTDGDSYYYLDGFSKSSATVNVASNVSTYWHDDVFVRLVRDAG